MFLMSTPKEVPVCRDNMEMRMRNNQVENDGVRVRDVMRQSRVGTISVNRLLWCCTDIIYVFTYFLFRIYWRREECEQKENTLTIVSLVIMQCDGDDDNFAKSNYDFHSKLCLYYSSRVRELRFVFSQNARARDWYKFHFCRTNKQPKQQRSQLCSQTTVLR